MILCDVLIDRSKGCTEESCLPSLASLLSTPSFSRRTLLASAFRFFSFLFLTHKSAIKSQREAVVVSDLQCWMYFRCCYDGTQSPVHQLNRQVIMTPGERIKCLLQIQGQSGQAPKYNGMWDCGRQIVKVRKLAPLLTAAGIGRPRSLPRHFCHASPRCSWVS